jgi:hypothetical protein
MVPGGDELMGAPLENDSHLRAVRRNTPYETEEQYMDTYYRLLRADCFAAIQKVSNDRLFPSIVVIDPDNFVGFPIVIYLVLILKSFFLGSGAF